MASKIREHLGQAIRVRREAQGLSQEELAHAADVSRVYLGSLERGAQVASIEVVERIASALEVSIPDLLDPPANAAPSRPEDVIGRRVAALAQGASDEALAVFMRIATAYFDAVAGKPGRGKKRQPRRK